MKSLAAVAIYILTLTTPAAIAGVILEIANKDMVSGGLDATKIHADSGRIRMDPATSEGAPESSMIFRDNEFLILNHSDKSYTVIDDALLASVSSQMSTAMKQMQELLKNMPPEQREMAGRMMKGRMKAFTQEEAPPAPAFKVKKTGSGKWRTYKCTQYIVSDDTQKLQEICAASRDQIDGIDEAMVSFKAMGAFMKKLAANLPSAFASGLESNPMQMMDQIDGFPVHTLQYDNGTVSYETSLESAIEQTVEDAVFSPPKDYKRQEMLGPQ